MTTRYLMPLFIGLLFSCQNGLAQTWDWIKTYSSVQECGETGENIGTDKWGNLYIKGMNICSSAGSNPYIHESNLILKYSNNGTFISSIPIVSGFWRGAVDPNGNVYVSAANFVKKYNSDGQLQWTDTIPNSFFSNITANAKGVVLTGYTYNYSYNSSDGDSSAYCMLDVNGNILWQRKGDYIPGWGGDVHLADNNKAYIVTNNELQILDSTGTQLGRFQLSPFNSSYYYNFKMNVLNDESIVITGIDAHAYPNYTISIARYSKEGNLIWSDKILGKGRIVNVRSDAENNIYLVGRTEQNGTLKYKSQQISPSQSIFAMKLDPMGNVIWIKNNIIPQGTFVPYDFILDSLANIYITGPISQTHTFDNVTASSSGGTYSDIFVAKLSQPAVVASIKEQKNNSELFAVSPNPAAGIFGITCADLKSCDIRLSILNSLGQQVYCENHQHKNGSYNKTFDMSTLSKGIYFVVINAGEEKVVKKVVLQ